MSVGKKIFAVWLLLCSSLFAQQVISSAQAGMKCDGTTDDTSRFVATMGTLSVSGGTLTISVGKCVLGSNPTAFTVPSNVTIDFTQQGALQVQTGTTITYNGTVVDNDLHRVFFGSGTVTTTGVQNCYTYPQWTGGSGIPTSTTANCALVSTINSAGLGGEFIALDQGYGPVASTSQLATAANVVDAWQFVQRYPQTFTRMSVRVVTTFGAGSHVGLAIYDSTGTLVPNATTGALDGTNVSSVQTVTVSPVTLNAGAVYFIGISTDGSGATTGRMHNIVFTPNVGTFTLYVNNARGNRFVTGSSVSAGGVPPNTLGTLSANGTSAAIPLLWVEP